jgi:AcrR family transcriptional regulator
MAATVPSPAAAPIEALRVPPTLRDRATRAVRAEVSDVAIRLFLKQGFDQTTVEQIASDAGLSRTSFFRYFATKEDVAFSHEEALVQRVLDALVARPATEPPWLALRRAFPALLDEATALPERALALARLMNETPALRARQLSRQIVWQDLLAPEIARRMGISRADDLRARALVAAAIACLNVAGEVWTSSNGAFALPGLFDQAMSALGE